MSVMRPLLVLTIFYLASCNTGNSGQLKNINFDSLKEPLIKANKIYIKKESDEIDQYVKFRGWEMTTSGTGVRYMIYKHGSGELAKIGQQAKINYKVSLLDGSVCYTSDKMGQKQFMIGEDHIESGLHEAITYMHTGDKAIIVLPSYLAFGLAGDGSKIPPHASVVYDIELVSLH
jgi:FKBP-type peptidyl-prolyl cis-trans isomerase FkpA